MVGPLAAAHDLGACRCSESTSQRPRATRRPPAGHARERVATRRRRAARVLVVRVVGRLVLAVVRLARAAAARRPRPSRRQRRAARAARRPPDGHRHRLGRVAPRALEKREPPRPFHTLLPLAPSLPPHDAAARRPAAPPAAAPFCRAELRRVRARLRPPLGVEPADLGESTPRRRHAVDDRHAAGLVRAQLALVVPRERRRELLVVERRLGLVLRLVLRLVRHLVARAARVEGVHRAGVSRDAREIGSASLRTIGRLNSLRGLMPGW